MHNRRQMPYLIGRVVCDSFSLHHPDRPAFLLLSDEVDGYFDPAGEPYRLVTMADLGGDETEAMRAHYNRQELSYALTPFLIDWVFRQGYDRVLFLKQESLVTGDLSPVMDLLDDASILLTPHLLDPLSSAAREKNILQCGVYNGGFVAFANTPEARQFLQWWQQRMIAHCHYDPAAGMHFEQRWLDLAPAYIERLGIVRDPGVNVGHWNLPERAVTIDDGAIRVDGSPCRLFRFSGYDADTPQAATRYFSRLSMETLGPAAAVFTAYREALLRHGWEATKEWPYSYAASRPAAG